MPPANARKSGPVLSQSVDPEGFRNMNLRLPVETRQKLEDEAKATGVSPTELIKRMIEARPVGYEAPVREAVKLAIQELIVDALAVPLSQARQKDLEKVSGGLGFVEPSHLMKEFALRAVADPDAAAVFLFGAIRSESELAMTAAATAPTSTPRRGTVKKVA